MPSNHQSPRPALMNKNSLATTARPTGRGGYRIMTPPKPLARRTMARPPLCGLEGHLRHAAPVVPDRRQDPAGPDAVDQPLVARHALRHGARPDHLADPVRRARVSDRFRLHRSRAADPDQRRRRATVRARSPRRSPISTCGHGGAGRARASRSGFTVAQRGAGRDPVPRGPRPRRLRSGLRAALLARARFRPTGCSSSSARGFLGKVSPVHFFWGSFDLAVTRFSGRTAPPHPGGIPNLPDAVTREAYSHEVSSAGFWPGGGAVDDPAFYSYAYPEPAGFAAAPVRPAAAFFHEQLGEFILPYDAVRTAAAPDACCSPSSDHLRGGGSAPAGIARRSSTVPADPARSPKARHRARSRLHAPIGTWPTTSEGQTRHSGVFRPLSSIFATAVLSGDRTVSLGAGTEVPAPRNL